MLENSVLALMDPELVVPSPEAARSRKFWLRMNEWANRPEFRLGPATLRALYDLINNPNPRWPLPHGELQQILRKLAARGFVPSNDERVLCERHLSSDYSPEDGEANNYLRLLRDLSVVDPKARVGLATIRKCWSDKPRPCEACEKSRISKVFELNSSGALAPVWRHSFLENCPGEFLKIKEFSSRLFPRLRFSKVAWDHLQTLTGDPREITQTLITHLGALNDLVIDIWSEEPTTHGRQRILKAHGVISSPENANTRSDRKAMKARRFFFGNEEVLCQWHTKLRPNTDRIYFSVGAEEVYIGSIIDHL